MKTPNDKHNPGGSVSAEASCSPFRVTLSRRSGFRMPPNTVSVARPHKWGNPYVVGQVMQDPQYRYINGCGESFELRDGIWIPDTETAVRAFRHWLRLHPVKIQELREELGGKNLACWCKQGTPCHADVLLELANAKAESSPQQETTNKTEK